MVIINDYNKSLYSGSIEEIKSPLQSLLFFVFTAGGGGRGGKQLSWFYKIVKNAKKN
jgi:hypothetical protein